MQYIALFSQDGLAITDMYQETVLYNVSYPWTGDVHFSNVVSPTNFSYILTTICKKGTGAHGWWYFPTSAQGACTICASQTHIERTERVAVCAFRVGLGRFFVVGQQIFIDYSYILYT